MDFFNGIYEKYGSREMEGIFRSYLLLSLILKQLLFAFFLAAGEQPLFQIGINDLNFREATEQRQGDETDKFQILLFVFNILETENNKNFIEQSLY